MSLVCGFTIMHVHSVYPVFPRTNRFAGENVLSRVVYMSSVFYLTCVCICVHASDCICMFMRFT